MRMGLYDIYDAFAAYIIHHHILYDFAPNFSINYGGGGTSSNRGSINPSTGGGHYYINRQSDNATIEVSRK